MHVSMSTTPQTTPQVLRVAIRVLRDWRREVVPMAPERAAFGEALYHISSRECQVLLQPDCIPTAPHRQRFTVAAALLSVLGWAGVEGFQGMGRSNRVPRPATVVETDLPPIAVDFRDLAEQAGLTSPVVSGRDDRKQYILEATGTGVAIFDFDNDGLEDVFVASATTLEAAGGDASPT